MIKNRGNVSGRDISPLCFRNMRIYQRKMTPASIGGEKQIRISGGCHLPLIYAPRGCAGIRKRMMSAELTRIPRQDSQASLEYRMKSDRKE